MRKYPSLFNEKKFEVATSNGLGGDTFTRIFFYLDLGVKVTQNVAQYPLHHVTYSATKLEVATSRYNFKKCDRRTYGQTDGRRVDFGTKLIYPFSKEKSGYSNNLFNDITNQFMHIVN